MSLFANYVPFKLELEKYIEHCQVVFNQIGDTASGNLVSGFIKELDNQRYNITIIGSLKRGKSTLLNTLMERSNDDISPISTTVCTSAIIKYLDKDLAPDDKKEKAVIYFNDPETPSATIPLSLLRNYVTEEKNPENRKQVKSVEVYGDFPAWSKAVTIIDSPGQNSVFGHHDTLLSDFLPYTDAIIFLVSADLPLDGGDIALLKELSTEQKEKIFFVLTKVDNINNPDDLEDVKTFVMGKIAEAGISCEKLYTVSALPVYQGLRKGLDPVRIETLKSENGIAELEDDLENFIVSKSDQTSAIRARVEMLVRKNSQVCDAYIRSTENLLTKEQFDIESFHAEEADLVDKNKQLRENTKKALKKFGRDWDKVLNKFSRKFSSRGAAVEDRIRDSLEKGGFIGALFQSFKLKKQVGRAVSMEVEPLVVDLQSELEEVISALNKDLDDELALYVKRTQGSDFGSIGGSVVAATALGGTALWGYSVTSAAVTNAMTAFTAWQGAGTTAVAATANSGTFWAWLGAKIGFTTKAGTVAAEAAATKAAAGTSALWAGVGAVAWAAGAIAATWIVQKIAHIGLVNWQSTRVPGMMDTIMTEMEEKLFTSLDSYKNSIIQEYQQNIESIISDNKERITEIQNLLVNNDPQERKLLANRVETVKQLLSEGSHIEKQIPMLK